MAATLRAFSTDTCGSAQSIEIAKPTGTVEGDKLVALIHKWTNGTPTAPSGWALEGTGIRFSGAGAEDALLFVYTKVAGGSEPAEYKWTDNDEAAAVMMAWQGAGGIEDLTFADSGTSSVNSLNAASVTAAEDGSQLVCGGGIGRGTAYTIAGVDAEVADIKHGTGAGNISMVVGREAVDAGETGTRLVTQSNTHGHGADQFVTFALVVTPIAEEGELHEAEASGAGTGTGAASATRTRLAEGAGVGAGSGSAAATRTRLASATGSGVGTGTASASTKPGEEGGGGDTSRWFEDPFAGEAFKFWWTVGADASLVGGRARLACTSAYDGLLVSDPVSALRGSTWTVEAPVLADTSAPGTETFFRVQLDETNGLWIWVSEGLIRFRELIAGVDSTTTETYDPEDHRWWRIRVDEDGAVFWETSSDGEAWTVRREKASAIPLEAVAHYELRTGDFEGGELEPAYTEFDNVAVDVVWKDFRADAETGDFSAFINVQAPEGRATVVTDPALQGTRSYRFELQPGDVEPETGDQRAEAISDRKYVAGNRRYVQDVIRVDAWAFGHWGLLGQIRSSDEDATNPHVCWQIEPITKRLLVSHGNGEVVYWTGPVVVLGEQFKLTVGVLFDPADGEVEVWLNDESQLMELGTGIPTMGSGYSYGKVGVYRDPESDEPAVVFHDDYRIGTELFSDAPPQEPGPGLYIQIEGELVAL